MRYLHQQADSIHSEEHSKTAASQEILLSDNQAFPPHMASDHGYQSFTFSLYNDQGALIFQCSVGSYNLLTQGISKETHGLFANNPYNLTEGDTSYYHRKMMQMDRLQHQMQHDVIIGFQEDDFIFYDHSSGGNEIKQMLRDRFLMLLNDMGFEMVQAKRLPGPVGQQKLVTLFRKDLFQEISSKGVFETSFPDGSTQYRGYETTFRVLGKNIRLVFTNIHLRYDHDYNEEIEQYQMRMEEEGLFHLMAGDTNARSGLKNALGHAIFATAFSSSHNNTTNRHFLTTAHDSGVPHADDRFFAVAPKTCYLVCTANTDRSEFVSINQCGEPIFTLGTIPWSGVTGIGKRWRPSEASPPRYPTPPSYDDATSPTALSSLLLPYEFNPGMTSSSAAPSYPKGFRLKRLAFFPPEQAAEAAANTSSQNRPACTSTRNS